MQQRPINPWAWGDDFGISQAIEFSGQQRVLICSGQTSVDESGAPLHAGDAGAQIGQALDNLEAVLKKADMTLANVVRLNVYTPDVDGIFQSWTVFADRLKAAGCKPACTLLGVARLFEMELLVEIEATAVA